MFAGTPPSSPSFRGPGADSVSLFVLVVLVLSFLLTRYLITLSCASGTDTGPLLIRRIVLRYAGTFEECDSLSRARTTHCQRFPSPLRPAMKLSLAIPVAPELSSTILQLPISLSISTFSLPSNRDRHFFSFSRVLLTRDECQ